MTKKKTVQLKNKEIQLILRLLPKSEIKLIHKLEIAERAKPVIFILNSEVSLDDPDSAFDHKYEGTYKNEDGDNCSLVRIGDALNG